ncbi:hypothetical protein K493DRAFT_313353 [Basidiobolus meristosporus CBS 931.73]|uniref:RlpA-like protein double-psi beta-barrel domain-containing protein n=1 Tax=Basidiobolus meristosporus CBS 931.73 TaxID=1314790 RepID=A0A1Y1YMX9_9FUNG|nr:hypothetical protein K493DRAFT_313353 [Basidiobolus meristosporus CBS 931.73]|eukprot:ORX99116.1 hypothetical protein K493DRAFT_313353 [Basidiobolus meristosporus CBS 931.73]
MHHFSVFLVALFTFLLKDTVTASSDFAPQENEDFTPENYPGLIIKRGSRNAICSHGSIIFLVETAHGCPADAGCYVIDRDSERIEKVLAELKRNGNEVWPHASRSRFPYRIDPKYSKRKSWPGKGMKATCKR